MTEDRHIDRIYDILSKNNVCMEVKPLSEQINYIKPDDDYDFHTYRILLLIYICGRNVECISKYKTLYGRRKFAFYDFLIRNPIYLIKTLEIKNKKELIDTMNFKEYEKKISFEYLNTYLRGPWDKRYDRFFGYMKSKDLINVKFDKINKSSLKMFCISLTELGTEMAANILEIENEWAIRMNGINQIFNKNTTNQNIDKFIYKNFEELILG